MKLSVIIPVYNEEKTIKEILSRVLNVSFNNFDKEIVVVNDASSDKTREILEGFSNKIKIFHHEKNMGKGSAVKTGLENATGDYVVIQDADLEYDPAEIPSLLNLLENDDEMVYGSRNLHHVPRSGFPIQRAGVWFITKLINMLYDAKLTDVWTCYKLFPKEAQHMFVSGNFDSELIFTVKALHEGFKIKEVPISHNPRGVEEGKKIKYRDGIKAIFAILSHKLLHLRKNNNKSAKDVLDIIVDPFSKSVLKKNGKTLVSSSGNIFLLDNNNRPYLIKKADLSLHTEEHESGINWLKSFFKQFPILYYTIWHLFCPVLMLVNGPRKIRKYLKPGTKIVDVGSGPERLGEEFINLDVFPFPEVDIVANATDLPFKDNSIEAIVSESVLEHVADAKKVSLEITRVLKLGGYVYISAPFIHPYHASPDDFNRWTISGLKYLFKDLEIVESGVRTGPWSALILFLAYWFGVILSFGYKKIAPFITHFLMLFMGPLKFLDFLFYWIPGSDVVATHLYIVARKK